MALLGLLRHPTRSTPVLFLTVAAVSVASLVWVGVRLVRQDRILEARQLEERREAAADRLTASLELILSAEEQRLADLPDMDSLQPADDVVWILIDDSEVRFWPDNALLYYPVMTSGREPPAHLYAEAEKSEFQQKNYSRAAHDLRLLTQSEDPAVRIGAGIRLARNLRKAGAFESALDVYAELSENSDHGVSISGVPADLVARRARCSLLDELGRPEELRRDAQNILDGLRGKRWRLDRASYLYYSDQSSRWLDQEPEFDAGQQALAEAVVWLWQNRRSIVDIERGSSGRRSFRSNDTSVTILWQMTGMRFAAMVAGPAYQHTRWFDPILESPDFSGIRLSIRDSESSIIYGSEPGVALSSTSRLASVSGLPWNITVVNADIGSDRNQFAQRRRLIMMGLGMLALLVLAASYLIGRAVSRELAAARLQADFVSAVSHEFRTPLTSMQQFTEMLVEDENLSEEKRRAYYEAQERATRRLSRLVESLLDFGRMEAGARPYRMERLDIGLLVETAVEDFKRETNSDSLVMECAVPVKGPVAKADREALTQALWNLLDNAAKYSGDSPVIHVNVEAGDQITIRVRDKGFGISPSEEKRIFRKFVRGTSAGKFGVKGTGIGLAMVKHIVDAHGGKILVASDPGKGSTFTILLPGGE